MKASPGQNYYLHKTATKDWRMKPGLIQWAIVFQNCPT